MYFSYVMLLLRYIYVHVWKYIAALHVIIKCWLLYRVFDMVNIHLFHDASNIVAMESVCIDMKDIEQL